MTGHERSLLYKLALETGLRAREIRSLRRHSFDPHGRPPTVTVEAAYSKRRRDDAIPLRAGLARELDRHLAERLPQAPAFAIPKHWRAAAMIREDLAAAQMPEKDASGRVVDFHALRHTFITNLARSQVHPKTAQVLARHSSITLTLDRYTHSLREDEVRARIPARLGGPPPRPRAPMEEPCAEHGPGGGLGVLLGVSTRPQRA